MLFHRLARPYGVALSLYASCVFCAEAGLCTPTVGFSPLAETASSTESVDAATEAPPAAPSAATSKRVATSAVSPSDTPASSDPAGAEEPPHLADGTRGPIAAAQAADAPFDSSPTAPSPPNAFSTLPVFVPDGGTSGTFGTVGSAFDRAEGGGADAKDGWRFSVEGATRLPVDVGAQLRLQSPFWLRLTAGIGSVPGAFIEGVTGALTSEGSLDAATSTVIGSTLSQGTTWNLRVGIRPSERFGFYADAGMGSMTLRGELELRDLASINLSQVPAEFAEFSPAALGEYQYQLTTRARLFLLEAGWEGHIGRHLLLGIGVGFLVATASTTSVEGNFEVPDVAGVRSALAEAEAQATSEIDTSIESFGFVPTLSLRLGFDFF